MKLYNLLILLLASVEHVTKILVERQRVFIGKKERAYDMRLYNGIPDKVEIQLSKTYGEEEVNLVFDKIKELDVEVALDSRAKHEIIMVNFRDSDQDDITI
jgi:hypothetical protein